MPIPSHCVQVVQLTFQKMTSAFSSFGPNTTSASDGQRGSHPQGVLPSARLLAEGDREFPSLFHPETGELGKVNSEPSIFYSISHSAWHTNRKLEKEKGGKTGANQNTQKVCKRTLPPSCKEPWLPPKHMHTLLPILIINHSSIVQWGNWGGQSPIEWNGGRRADHPGAAPSHPQGQRQQGPVAASGTGDPRTPGYNWQLDNAKNMEEERGGDPRTPITVEMYKGPGAREPRGERRSEEGEWDPTTLAVFHGTVVNKEENQRRGTGDPRTPEESRIEEGEWDPTTLTKFNRTVANSMEDEEEGTGDPRTPGTKTPVEQFNYNAGRIYYFHSGRPEGSKDGCMMESKVFQPPSLLPRLFECTNNKVGVSHSLHTPCPLWSLHLRRGQSRWQFAPPLQFAHNMSHMPATFFSGEKNAINFALSRWRLVPIFFGPFFGPFGTGNFPFAPDDIYAALVDFSGHFDHFPPLKGWIFKSSAWE